MFPLRKIMCVVHAKRENKLLFLIHQRASSPPSSHLNFYIWISLARWRGGNEYGLVIVDDYSRFTWVFFLHDKSEVQETFKKFAKRAQNEFETKIKKVRSDNGTEFKNSNKEEYLDEEGISH